MLKLFSQQYHFLVEGECEERYLQRLQDLINGSQAVTQHVSFVIKRNTSMTSMVKNLSPWVKTTIVEVIDYEGSSQSDQQTFMNELDDMAKATRLKPGIKCVLGYSNLTFELWILLHKMDCRKTLDNKKQYLGLLKKAYGSDFETLDKFKEEKKFQKVLKSLTLEDVKTAIQRAEVIRKWNEQDSIPKIYRKYRYFEKNPDCSLQEFIRRILEDCGLMK
ncbi:RloB domain-containing protein [Acidaminococcus timonensis]|uniref:RloB domain-containing protein n=1 Tax=Acidaminococcus timonensis TaxID=1871002 RepID=UPI003A5C3344